MLAIVCSSPGWFALIARTEPSADISKAWLFPAILKKDSCLLVKIGINCSQREKTKKKKKKNNRSIATYLHSNFGRVQGKGGQVGDARGGTRGKQLYAERRVVECLLHDVRDVYLSLVFEILQILLLY